MEEKADPGKKSHKKKTKHNQVHKKPTPRSQAKEFLKRDTVGEYSTCLRRSQVQWSVVRKIIGSSFGKPRDLSMKTNPLTQPRRNCSLSTNHCPLLLRRPRQLHHGSQPLRALAGTALAGAHHLDALQQLQGRAVLVGQQGIGRV